MGSLQLSAMHPYSCSSSRHLAALPTIVRCHMHLPPSSCSWPGTALAPDTHPDRALPWTFVGTHPDQWVSGGLPPAGCTAPASWLGHAPAPPHPLACGPGESRTRHTPVSDCNTMSHSSQEHTGCGLFPCYPAPCLHAAGNGQASPCTGVTAGGSQGNKCLYTPLHPVGREGNNV